MPTATDERLRRAAEALAEVSPSERLAVLDEAGRMRREQCCAELGLAAHLDAVAAGRAAEVARALADPVRAQIFDLVRRHGGELCQCELQPLFDVSQPTLSHHLRKLVDAGLIDVERRGRWAYYSVNPLTLEEARSWLS
jgi:ArsR family transcriptional regulator, arsenate/arsenite/antimonite-responsive transcriptional repressor